VFNAAGRLNRVVCNIKDITSLHKTSISHTGLFIEPFAAASGSMASEIVRIEDKYELVYAGSSPMRRLVQLVLGLGPKIIESIFEILKVINNKEGVTIFLVEQNLHTTLDFCARAYILENGRIKMEGSSGELLGDDYVKKAYLGLG